MQQQQQSFRSHNQSLASSVRCLQDSISVAFIFQCHVPRNATASSITPSSHLLLDFPKLLLMWNICYSAWFCIGYFSILTTCSDHSLTAINILYFCSCAIRNFNAPVLYNASTFHVSKFISSCLCHSRRHTVFLSFIRGLPWGFETAVYYELSLSVPSSNTQHGGSGNRLRLIVPTFSLPTYLPTYFHVYLLVLAYTPICLSIYIPILLALQSVFSRLFAYFHISFFCVLIQ